MIATRLKNEVTQLIKGPAGQLELAVFVQQDKNKGKWGIVCHPHPLHGGAMYNKVVTTLTKTFQELGLNTVRFNFRGVGKSTGHFAKGEGELDDLIAVINWVQESYKQYDIWLGGFSFGAFIAAKAATKIPVSQLVTIAPPIENFPMEDLPPITCPWVLAQGEKDDVVSPISVLNWAKSREPKPTILRFPDAGHFFHGHLQDLRMRLLEVLKTDGGS